MAVSLKSEIVRGSLAILCCTTVVAPIAVAWGSSAASAFANKATADASPGRIRVLSPEGAVDPSVQVEVLLTPPLQPGQKRFRLRHLAAASVDADGYVVFPSVSRNDVLRYARNGNINVEVVAGKSGQYGSWSYPVSVSRSGQAPVSLAPKAEDLQAPGANGRSAQAAEAGGLPSSLVGGTLKLQPAPARVAGGDGMNCGQSVRVSTQVPFVKLAVVRSERSDITGQYTYQVGQKSELGVAVKALGSVNFSGRVTQENTATVGWDPIKNKTVQYEMTWEYATYKQKVCLRPPTDYYYRYTTTPVGARGGTRKTTPGRYSAPYCVPASKGQTTTFSSNRNVEWSDGVQLAATGASFNLSSLTGYNQTGSVSYKWQDKKGSVCGQFDYPYASGPNVIIGSTKAM